jgi:A/G-specific adenine glycosylase
LNPAPKIASAARPALIRWFAREARSLPWRPPHALALPAAGDTLLDRSAPAPARSPYAVWISEVMLQQTQVATVIPYFERWMGLFRDPALLAAAPEEAVLRAWAGLGYYARARNLQKAARTLVERGAYPESAEGWKALPGIGDYTAGAISSLAFGLRAPILDGNVVRVFSRLLGLEFLPGDSAEAKRIYWDLARQWADHPRAGEVNEGLMELGALVCVPSAPRCEQCPLSQVCIAFKEGRQSQLPPLRKREKAEAVAGAAVRAVHKGKVLFERRGAGAFLAGHEMFPLFLGAEAGEWQKAFLKRFPGLRLKTSRAGARARHFIMSKRYDLEIWDCEVDAPAQSVNAKPADGPQKIWTDAKDVGERLTNSLARKIWNAKTTAAKDPKDRKP